MDTLNEMLGGIDLSATDGAEDDVMSMMQSMMESLLSKDVLYPSLQAICQKVNMYLYGSLLKLLLHCIL